MAVSLAGRLWTWTQSVDEPAQKYKKSPTAVTAAAPGTHASDGADGLKSFRPLSGAEKRKHRVSAPVMNNLAIPSVASVSAETRRASIRAEHATHAAAAAVSQRDQGRKLSQLTGNQTNRSDARSSRGGRHSLTSLSSSVAESLFDTASTTTAGLRGILSLRANAYVSGVAEPSQQTQITCRSNLCACRFVVAWPQQSSPSAVDARGLSFDTHSSG